MLLLLCCTLLSQSDVSHHDPCECFPHRSEFKGNGVDTPESAALVCANTAIAVVVRESNTKGYFRGNTHSSKMGSCSHDVWIMFISKYLFILLDESYVHIDYYTYECFVGRKCCEHCLPSLRI